MTKKPFASINIAPKTLIIGIESPLNKSNAIESYFDEFVNLVHSNGVEPDETLFIRIRSIDPGYFITKGKLEEIKKLCDEKEIEHVIISEILLAQQERNLNRYLECTVFDRTRLILEIFEKNAHTAEGKTQVAIAMFQHKKSRVAGKGLHLSQQAGHIGIRGGPGETAKERELRLVEEEILKLRRLLERMQKTRETQRKQRLVNQVPHACLIGYTNAGKSSILNALTKSDVLAEDRLFATLDTTTREFYVNGIKKGLMSDTVGFIQNLPHRLIEAFKSTLSELQYADLLLHVVDLADPNWEDHIKVVHHILEELEVDKEMLYVFNKIDKVPDIDALFMKMARYQPCVAISTLTKEGIEPLTNYLDSWKPAKK